GGSGRLRLPLFFTGRRADAPFEALNGLGGRFGEVRIGVVRVALGELQGLGVRPLVGDGAERHGADAPADGGRAYDPFEQTAGSLALFVAGAVGPVSARR